MTATVYGFTDADGEWLYIGCTEYLDTRVAAHHRKSWWSEVTQIHLLGDRLTRREANALERRAIETFEPRHNFVFTRAWRELHALDGANIQTRPLTELEITRIRAAFAGTSDAAATA
jgi:hypothetical protein